jgi:hypothetical protein
VDDGSATQRFERDENVIARIELQYRVGHVFVNWGQIQERTVHGKDTAWAPKREGLAAEL